MPWAFPITNGMMVTREKLKSLFWVVLSILVVVPTQLFAQGVGDPPGGTLENPLRADNLYEFVKEILGVASNIGFLVAIFFIVYSGYLFVTARGSDDKLKTAKNTFLWTVVGTAILLGAWLFATVIEGTINQLK